MSTRRLDGEAVSHVWMKAMVTVTAMAGLVAGQFIMLPMVDFDPQVHEGARARWSIMALGLNPLMSAFLLVELAAVLVPVWQPLREGGPVGRRKLRRAALILGLILATGQAVVMVLAAETLRVASTPGWTFRLVTIMTLLGATAVLIVLTQLVDRHGLGNGFSILILASLIPESLQVFGNVWAAARSDTIGFDSLLNGAFIVAGLVAATLWMFSRYRLPIHGLSDNTSPVRLPACGIVPFTMVPAALLYLTSLATR